jgi:hypothetical protein
MRPRIQGAEAAFNQGKENVGKAATRLATVVVPLLEETVSIREEGITAMRNAIGLYADIVRRLGALGGGTDEVAQEVHDAIALIGKRLEPPKQRIYDDVFRIDALAKLQESITGSGESLSGMQRSLEKLGEGDYSLKTITTGTSSLQTSVASYRRSKDI